MLKLNNILWFSPTDLSTYFASPFASWMRRYQIENPAEKFAITADPTMALLAKRGELHEQNYLAILKVEFNNIIEIAKQRDFEKAAAETIAAMKSGAEIIYQGAFIKDNFRGFSDFLVRVNLPSKLGDYSYEVWDTKLALAARPEYILQLSCYSEMLMRIQGVSPEKICIVLGNNKKIFFSLADFSAYYRRFKQAFLDFHAAFDLAKKPIPQPWEKLGDWAEHGEEILVKLDHLIQVAGMTQMQIKKFEAVGIKTMQQLADSKFEDRPKGMPESSFHKLQRQAFMQKQTIAKGTTQFELRKLDSLNSYGLQTIPPAHQADVFFDMEGFPLVEKGLEYLFGAVFEEQGKIKFIDWWALDKAQEKKAFEAWIDWAFARWKANPGMHIYHYASYEVSAMKRLTDAYITRQHEVDAFLRQGVFVDLYQVVREGLVVGEPSYSIKKLERLYGFKRTADVKLAGDSIIQFANWLELQDGADWKSSKILKEIRDYNEEDCISTLQLMQWLRQVQLLKKIKYQPKPEDEAKPTEVHKSVELLQRLEGLTPKDPLKKKVHGLIFGAVGYHRREHKPQWWSHFDRLGKLPEELTEDMDSLADCTRVKQMGTFLELSFNPEQETKIAKDDDVIFLHEEATKLCVAAIDYAAGSITLEIKKGGFEIPEEVTLLPAMPFMIKTIETALFEIAEDWAQHRDLNKLNPCLRDLLTQANSRFTDGRKVIFTKSVAAAGFIAEVVDACKKLEQSVLAIQGPPGSGKTYIASHMIAALLKDKKRVGIISNTHKAINLLMQGVQQNLASDPARKTLNFYKIRNYQEDFLADNKILYAKSATDFFKKKPSYNLVGGTAYFFSHKDAIAGFDYLFVEEAGQFALANTIAAQRATKNLVLLGDQMQLEQPMQGKHPDDIAESALGHYLAGVAAVSPDKGVFLALSRRMHPNVCSYISEMVYESKLSSHQETLPNSVIIKHPKLLQKKLIHKKNGIIFVPVKHEGNSQGSDEEVLMIQALLAELASAEIHRNNITEKFKLNNCLFVAPYNLQVGKIRAALGDEARVGSVDLFQGQEADIVILSMCSSDAEVSPRGLEFLLNKNRMNVAISRAKTLAIVVGSEKLVASRAKSIKTMELLNMFCRLLEVGS